MVIARTAKFSFKLGVFVHSLGLRLLHVAYMVGTIEAIEILAYAYELKAVHSCFD